MRNSAAAALAFVVLSWAAFRVLGQDLSAAAEGLLKVGLWVVPSLILVRRAEGGTWRDAARALGLGGSVSAGVLFGAVSTLPIAVLVALQPDTGLNAWAGRPVHLGEIARLWNVVLGSVLLGPFSEEVLFRGFIIHEFGGRQRWRALPVIALSGALFGLAHVGNAGGPPIAGIGFGGAVFAWIALRRRSIWPVIGLHGCLNLWWVLWPAAAGWGHPASLLVAALVVIGLDRLEAGIGIGRASGRARPSEAPQP